MGRKWLWLTDTGGEISFENHWQQAAVMPGACTPGVPVMLGIPAFHAPECCRTYKDFTLSSWYKASSGKSCAYFEVCTGQCTGKTAFFPPSASQIMKNHQIVKIWGTITCVLE